MAAVILLSGVVVGFFFQGAIAIADALHTGCCAVELLDVSACKVGEQGGGALCGSLVRNRSLTCLDIRWNKIGSVGALALAATLKGIAK